MDTERRELWDQLQNEPKRAFHAFQTFLRLPSGSRTVVEAYRRHVDNPQATRVSDTWTKWSKTFAWSPRAEAYDHHLELIRERAVEEAIKDEAQQMAREAERSRYRYNELLARNFDAVIEYLESGEFVEDMRPSDVINITKNFFEATKHFGGLLQQRENEMVDWTPDEQAELERIVGEIEACDMERDSAKKSEASKDGEEVAEDSEGDS